MDLFPRSEIDVQFYEGGEIDLHLHKNDCKKNPGHHSFIPADQFSIEKLPLEYRDPDIYDLIKLTSDLTVRINSPYVSLKRPTCLPGTPNVPYCLGDKKGTTVGATGTGRVWEVEDNDELNEDPCGQMYTDEDEYKETTYGDTGDDESLNQDLKNKAINSETDVGGRQCRARFKTCPCEKCKRSKTPSRRFMWVKVITARHVVFNNKEAERANCRLFFDSSNTLDKVILTGQELVTLDPQLDWCWLRCVTCDLDLAARLKKMCERRYVLWAKVGEKFSKSREENKLTVIVSHPHGCSKQISIGSRTNVEVVKTMWTKYHYTTATCPGSSGATIIMLGYAGSDDHVHSGGVRVESNETDEVICRNVQVNYSACGDDYWLLPKYSI